MSERVAASERDRAGAETYPASSGRLEQLARQLAASQSVERSPGIRPALTELLPDYDSLLRKINQYFQGASESELSLSYAAEWMLDNYYVVHQALRQIGEDLPAGYYRQLPKLASGPLAGYPRVYEMARQLIHLEHALLEIERVKRFVDAYQVDVPLTMGELWAIPIMLRMGVVENLLLAAGRITGVSVGGGEGALPALDLAELISDEEVVANSVISLRNLGVQDWKEFFESLSLVELVLGRDPALIYAGMDFDTRDRYRKVVEEIALASGNDELEVARQAIRLAQTAMDRSGATRPLPPATPVPPRLRETDGYGVVHWHGFHVARPAHVGYHLLDRGRPRLEQILQVRLPWYKRLGRWVLAHPTPVYLGSVAVLTMLLWLVLLGYAWVAGASTGPLALVAVLALFPAMTVAVTLVNWLVTKLVAPRVLPKMDFREGLPEETASMVVIPALLSSRDEVRSLLRQLEVHYLRNPDPQLYFALLTDFSDAPQQHMPEDEALIQEARQGLQALNAVHARRTAGPFYLFHRERRWNPCEGVWMGWERKRGKLHEFNRLLLRGAETSFSVQEGDLKGLPPIKYVITLDADTILPMEAGRRLVATLAHPLNQAEFDRHSGKVVAGYTVLQPRTEINPPSANRSFFTRVFAGDTGLDLYTLAVSDVYQDLFGEGIYVGKGIYDVAAFERSLEGRIPENALLSHDLFEGIHGRAGLVTDVVLIEDYPPDYLVHVLRSHRWARGDWQLLPWLLPRVPSASGEKLPNRLALIDRWKILDNLRRSLVAPSLLALIMAGWLALPGSPFIWTMAGLLALGAPVLTGMLDGLFQVFRGATLNRALISVRNGAIRWLLALAFLPYEALLVLDAIFATLFRMYVTRRHLLRWTTAAQTASLVGERLQHSLTRKHMLTALLLASLLGLLVWLFRPGLLLMVSPVLLAWLFSPEIAYWISRPIRIEPEPLSEHQRRRLRGIARRTWLYFERFVGPEDRWLAPDHFQESPLGTVAHRTSPTNLGLALLASLGAYDLGYVGLLDLAARLRSILENMAELERYRGHFLNWYETRSLEPLPPRYVSTVDSGNLAACLIALRIGCHEMEDTRVFRWESWEGLLDLLTLLKEMLEPLTGTEASPAAQACIEYLEQVSRQVLSAKSDPATWPQLLAETSGEVLEQLERQLMALLESGGHLLDAEQLHQLRLYTQRLRYQLENTRREADLLMPWIFTLGQAGPRAVPAPLDLLARDSTFRKAFGELTAVFPITPRLTEIDAICQAGLEQLAHLRELLSEKDGPASLLEWVEGFGQQLDSARMNARILQIGYHDLARRCEDYLREMDFRFLFDRTRQVFHIGYNVSMERLDGNYYDLLASEARLASIVAIAKGDVPQSHWLHLSRPLTQVDSTRALLSWSATMFEYLMPLMLQRSIEGTLLHQSSLAAIHHQIRYARARNVPWGISESGYYRFDANQFYQYRAFGVPGLGYKRGLGEDLVVSPYASFLALPLRPREVMENVDRLIELGMLGTFGFYEAIDFTPGRLPLGERYRIVRSYMAHHQGMILVSIVNYLKEDVMVRRFHTDPRIQSVELLLQEQVPGAAPIEFPHLEDGRVVRPAQPKPLTNPWRVRVQTPQPRLQYLSNGRYDVVITNAGAGYSRWRDFDLTRWRPDTTLNNWGTWIYVQDLDRVAAGDPALWSATLQPSGVTPQSRDVYFDAHMAHFRRRDHDISVSMEVTVPPEDDLEIRRIVLTNHSEHWRRLRLVSYGEVILAPQATDARHPVFNKLFIQSQWLPEQNALLFWRRLRARDEEPVFLLHAVVAEQGVELTGAYEADRARFLGRGNTPRAPQALLPESGSKDGVGLTGNAGGTLDPIMSIGQEIDLEPHASLSLAYLTTASHSRQEALATVERFRAWHLVERAFDQARSQAELEMRQIGLTSEKLERTQALLSLLLYPDSSLRARPAILSANRKGQPSLWAYGVSGDYPILLLEVAEREDLALVQEALRAHAYWRNRRIRVDLVVLNMKGSDYGGELAGHLHRLLRRMNADGWLNRRGGIFLLNVDQIGEGDRELLEAAARVILRGEAGSLARQLEPINRMPQRLPPFFPSTPAGEIQEETPAVPRPQDLLFDNGLGGFSRDGREYLLYLEPGGETPAPWVNVIANPEFGFLVSEAGGGFTWSLNSGENRLTPWSNDPVSDTPGEALYLRDEETASVWSPTPRPAGAAAPYLVRHGAGYTIFEHHSHGLKQQLRLFVVPDAPLKIVHLRLVNTWERPRRITATYYAEWVLGSSRETAQQYLVPEFDNDCQALLARNPYNPEFAGRVAFLAASQPLHALTADRAEFLGRMGSYARPAALRRIGLAGTVEAGLDPCAALQLHIDLVPGETQEVFFLLGQGEDRQAATDMVGKYRQASQVQAAWDASGDFWEQFLGSIQVHTPEPAMDLLLNRWLLYQALACRIWGRSAFYQSSGAYGFRDQLQDVMCLTFAKPELAREHLLRAARHQFEEGDVLHWWHPPSGRGVRTRYSDDLLWLPYVTAHYVQATGDEGVLSEQVPFIRGALLEPGEKERYGHYPETERAYSLYEHCRRALEKGSTSGPHGLPLMGGGDWNDGMNRVGVNGRGESVWLGWFLYHNLVRFAEICERRGDEEYAGLYRERASGLLRAIEEHAWDGRWYLRAFYDDGSPLGSSENRECQIDSLSQSWAVLVAAGDRERAVQAMQSVAERLVVPEDRLVLLFAPPFDKTPRDPGYIKGYLPGVRENGGQYTHAALWAIWAHTELEQGEYAEELFRMINPIYHTDTLQKTTRYMVEPYVIAADVYSVAPHNGRGGWTWYTGSSGWMYRLGIEAILGLRRIGEGFVVDPCVPPGWDSYEMVYTYCGTAYRIHVENPHGVSRGVKEVLLDGAALPDGVIPMDGEGRVRQVRVVMG